MCTERGRARFGATGQKVLNVVGLFAKPWIVLVGVFLAVTQQIVAVTLLRTASSQRRDGLQLFIEWYPRQSVALWS